MENHITDYIKISASTILKRISGGLTANEESQTSMIHALEKGFLEEEVIDENIISLINSGQYSYVYNFLKTLLLYQFYNFFEPSKIYFNFDNPIVNQLITKEVITQNGPLKELIQQYITLYFDHYDNSSDSDFINYLHRRNITDKEILEAYVPNSGNMFFHDRDYIDSGLSSEPNVIRLNALGKYIKPLLIKQRDFIVVKKEKDYFEIINSYFKTSSTDDSKYYWFLFQLWHFPYKIEGNIKQYLVKHDKDRSYINLRVAYALLSHDTKKYEKIILDTINSTGIEDSKLLEILIFLDKKNRGKYDNEIIKTGDAYIKRTFYNPEKNYYYYRELFINNEPVSIAFINGLLRKDVFEGKAYLEKFISEASFVLPHNIKQLDDILGAKALPLLIELLFKDASTINIVPRYFETLFEILQKHKAGEYLGKIIDFAVNHAKKHPRIMACNYLGRQIPEIIEPAKELLNGKNINQRIVGALILSEIDNDDVSETLSNALAEEINDDTRDIMLESLSEKHFAKPFSIEETEQMISIAEKRKKLNKWNEKWLDEESLPDIFWKDKDTPLNKKVIRFLFYRMKRAKGINSDIEAKQVIQLIDKDKSEKFTKVLLQAFQESNFDAKSKYYLSLAGFLGNDNTAATLNSMLKKAISDKRMKMAEYILGALVMTGTDKALRAVETIYRKMANKKPKLSQAAKEALDAAARELNITSDELSDRLIPDFGFEGQYKTFEIDSDEYRAFVGNDFKINFINEDNKIRKSLPSGAPKELKTEFKEIQKEINDVVKTQAVRLEKYLVDERRWLVNDWQQFFFENPIMFVYALKLIWGEFDSEGRLVNSFYCAEDASLYDVYDEETELSENNYIGILHPLYLDNKLCEEWKNKLYEMEMTTIFPITDRKVFKVEPEEEETNFTRHFFNKEVPKGADFVSSFLVRKLWIKTSGDGGCAEFHRRYKDGEIIAWANIEGPAVYYLGGDTKATVYEISFRGKSYTDKLKLKDIPGVFYSEVLSDIDELINQN